MTVLPRGLCPHQPVQDTAVAHCDHHHAEVGADHRAGVDDVLEQIIQIVTARSGQVGTDLPAAAIKLVTCRTACRTAIDRGSSQPGERCAIELFLSWLIRSRRPASESRISPQTAVSCFAQRRVAQALNLAGVERQSNRHGDLAGGNLIQ